MGLKFLPCARHTVPFAAGNGFGQLPRFAGRTFKLRTTPTDRLQAHEIKAFADAPGATGIWFADAQPVERALADLNQ